MAQPIRISPEEAARVSAQLAEYNDITRRLYDQTKDLAEQYPHHWAGMNSDRVLILADTMHDLLAKLRPDGDNQRTVSVIYLDPDPPDFILSTETQASNSMPRLLI